MRINPVKCLCLCMYRQWVLSPAALLWINQFHPVEFSQPGGQQDLEEEVLALEGHQNTKGVHAWLCVFFYLQIWMSLHFSIGRTVIIRSQCYDRGCEQSTYVFIWTGGASLCAWMCGYWAAVSPLSTRCHWRCCCCWLFQWWILIKKTGTGEDH